MFFLFERRDVIFVLLHAQQQKQPQYDEVGEVRTYQRPESNANCPSNWFVNSWDTDHGVWAKDSPRGAVGDNWWGRAFARTVPDMVKQGTRRRSYQQWQYCDENT